MSARGSFSSGRGRTSTVSVEVGNGRVLADKSKWTTPADPSGSGQSRVHTQRVIITIARVAVSRDIDVISAK